MAGLVQIGERRPGRASWIPFGLGFTKPHHYREMVKVAWENRRHPLHAWRVLTRGVCDGCALGTTGLRDWTLQGVHLCMVRLSLLRLNTMDALDPALLADVERLAGLSGRELRALGRLGHPMRRRKGERGFTRVGWEEALDAVARRVAVAPDRFATYMTSRGIANEVYYAVQKAVRLVGSPHVDNSARLCHSPSTAAMKSVLGVGASTLSYKDWYGTDAVIFCGSNPANDQPVAMKYLHEAKKQGTRVYLVNPLEEPGMLRYWIPSTPESALFGTRIVDRVFRVATGGDLAFFQAVTLGLCQRGAIHQSFLDGHTEGWAAYRSSLEKRGLDELVLRSGASREDVEAFTETLARARNAVFVWSMGLTQHAHGTETIKALLTLGLARGFVGRAKAGFMPIRGHSGVQGGAEMGAYSTAYPGGAAIDSTGADRLASLWGFRPPERPGLDCAAMLEAAGRGELDVLYSIGGNFLDTLPQPEAIARALGRVPVRVHQDVVLTSQMLVEPGEEVWLFPAKTRYEHAGGVTETTTERRVVYSPEIPGHPVGDAKEEWWPAVEIARRARPDKASLLDGLSDAPSIRRDISRTIPSYQGIEKLARQGDHFQWGGERLCEGGVFPLPGGKARIQVVEAPMRKLGERELFLSTRRGKQFNSMVQEETDRLTGAHRDEILVSPEDMRRLGLSPAQRVKVRSASGEVQARVFEAAILPGNVQMHWPEANPLIETGRLDPGGRVPDYNAVVTLEPL